MPISNINVEDIKVAVNAAIEKYGVSRSEIVPVLNFINREFGYIPAEAFEELYTIMKVPKSQLFSAATFYHMLSTKPRGKNIIKFCESAPCHVVGGKDIINVIKEELNIEPDQTTPDGKWSLVTTSCLGLCSIGPVIMINDDVYGNVTPEKIPQILAKYD